MFGIMPAYGLVEAGMQPPPLTSGQKFKLAVQYLNPYTFLFVAAEAGVNQARNSPSEYGQGAEGYGKRYGAGFADGLTDGIFVTGVYPSLLRQDPRYYRLGDGGFSHRVGYAVSRILVTRQDSGRKAFNFSEVSGQFFFIGPGRDLLSQEPERFFRRGRARRHPVCLRCRLQCVEGDSIPTSNASFSAGSASSSAGVTAPRR